MNALVLQSNSAVRALLDAADSPQVAMVALLTARLLPIASLTPLLGGASAPARLRFAAALLLAIALAPLSGMPALEAPIWMLLIKEGVIGLTMAVIVKLLFETYAAVGRAIDDARGAGNGELFDPFNNQQQSPLGAFLVVAAVTVFLSAGGHAILLNALTDSLVLFPPHSLALSPTFGSAGAEPVISAAAELFALTVRLAFPALAVTLLIDVALGLINRLAPQVQATQLGYIIKGVAAIGVSALALSLVFTLPVQSFLRTIQQWLQSR